MTPEDRALDADFFLTQQPLTLFRLARARYANLSGLGAASAAGRWNRLGQEAIYTSTEMGIPVLERLAHTPKDLMPSNLALMKIKVSGEWQRGSGNTLVDPRTGGCMRIYSTLSQADEWHRKKHPELRGVQGDFAIAVPSIIVPVWNVVLYPKAMAFWEHVSLESIEAFEFDPRLFPENTPLES